MRLSRRSNQVFTLYQILVLRCVHLELRVTVAKEMNHFLLKKVLYLLSNAQLDKSFWAEALKYASYLMNKLLSTVIGGKTPLDI